MAVHHIITTDETKRLFELSERRKQYKSLDEMVREEGITAVFEFLSSSPTEIGGYYRHTQMPVIPYTVQKWNANTGSLFSIDSNGKFHTS